MPTTKTEARLLADAEIAWEHRRFALYADLLRQINAIRERRDAEPKEKNL